MLGWLLSLAIVVTVTVPATGNNLPRPDTSPVAGANGKSRHRRLPCDDRDPAPPQGRQPKKPRKSPKWQAHVDNMSLWFAMGLAPALQPWALIGAGTATIVEAQLSSRESYLALVLFCIIASVSYLGMEVNAGLKPGQSQEFLARFRTWMDGQMDQVIIWGG